MECHPSLLSCCHWAAQVFQMITATSLSAATEEATFVPAPIFSPFLAWPLFSSLLDLGHLHGYPFYQHLVPDLPTSGCFPKLPCSNGDTKSARSSSSYCNYQGREGVGRVGGKEIEAGWSAPSLFHFWPHSRRCLPIRRKRCTGSCVEVVGEGWTPGT